MSIEDLMDLRVTSASKKEESVSQTAAAIYVITQEDIRRSGMGSLPDLLRMVPGLDVAQLDGGLWAVSSRGFNARNADKMLVLIDGRVIYTPTFAGVLWELQDAVLEDIERIEVIRGPGASLWGANAVNGVINIISRKADETQGGLITTEGGNQELTSTTVQYGGPTRNGGTYRVFAKYFDQLPFAATATKSADDARSMLHGGFRTDLNPSSRDSFTLQGDLYEGHGGHTSEGLVSLQPFLFKGIGIWTELKGGNLLGHWERKLSSGSEIELLSYYDRYDRVDSLIGEHRRTGDVDFQNHLLAGSRNDIVWGTGLRYSTNRDQGSVNLSFDPATSNDTLFSGFVQDEILLKRDRLRLTLGLRVEDDSYAGPQLMPDARLLWTPTPHQAVWLATSRSVRSPARSDRDLRVNVAAAAGPGGIPMIVTIFGNPGIASEVALSYQAGYRAQWSKKFSTDLALFRTNYSGLEGVQTGSPLLETEPPPAHLVLPQQFQNSLFGETAGVEITSTWQATGRWKLTGGYSWLHTHLQSSLPGDHSSEIAHAQGLSPTEQFNFRSYLSLPRNFDFDAMAYFVGNLPDFAIPAYTRVDTRVAWRPAERWELSVTGQNLFQPRHVEFTSDGEELDTSMIRRSVYAKIVWRF